MDLNESWTYGSPPVQGRRRAEAGVKVEKEVAVPYAAQAEAVAWPVLPRMWQQYASQKAWQTQAKPAVPWAAAPVPWCAAPAQWGAMPGPWTGAPGPWGGLPGPWGVAPAPCGAPPVPGGAVVAAWKAAPPPCAALPAAWQGAPAPYARQAVKRKGVGPYARGTLAVDAAVGLDARADPT
ncbi:MAG: hypothetical protein ACM3ZA_07080 [Bacillota bacterium]